MQATVDKAPTSKAAILQWLTVAHGALEGCVALYAAYLAGSVALISFGLDSWIEVISASIVLWRLASLKRPGRFVLSELAGLRLVGICFFGLAIVVGIDGVDKLIHHKAPEESLLGIAVAIFSVVAMPFLAAAKRKISGQIGSHSMNADARQTDFCFYLASILLAGLLIYRATGWWWIDPVAGLVMVPIVVWEGIQACRGVACGCCSH